MRRPDFSFPDPDQAIEALCSRLRAVPAEQIKVGETPGRVLAQPLVTDRPSPPADVSAMDGYAVRLTDLTSEALPVTGVASAGRPAPKLPSGGAVKIFTGAPLPVEAEAVIPREELTEEEDRISLPPGLEVRPGQYIRRRGENAPAGEEVAPPGIVAGPAQMAALAAFGVDRVAVRRRVRIQVLVTGDELLAEAEGPKPWMIRDSNGPSLTALLGSLGHVSIGEIQHVPDDPEGLTAALRGALDQADAVLFTGGVSMGDRDHGAEAVEAAEGELIFHWLPIRPGKPILGAVADGNRVLLGLPGNPVSALVTARRFALPALAALAGTTPPPPMTVEVGTADDRTLPLHWHRLVTLDGDGRAHVLPERGSGDLAALAASDGFIALPPDARTEGRLPYYSFHPGGGRGARA